MVDQRIITCRKPGVFGYGAGLLVLLLAACQPTPPTNVAAPMPKPVDAPVVKPEVPAPTGSIAAASPKASTKVVMPSLDFLPGPLYLCEVAGTREPLQIEARVDALCRRHPEMGPCQYERDACRRAGGRVFTARGEEVTMSIEAEYDRVVQRVRFRSN